MTVTRVLRASISALKGIPEDQSTQVAQEDQQCVVALCPGIRKFKWVSL